MFRIFAVLVWLAVPAAAQTPRVVADIAPVHGLVSQVMSGAGSPDLLLRPDVSPHSYAMRPSDARRLQQADLVFWVGEALTPWLARPLETLAGTDRIVTLLDEPGISLIESGDADGHEDHDNTDDHDHGHDHRDGVDPHAWLDPTIAGLWLDAIARELAAADPEHADLYRANARDAREELDRLDRELAGALEPVRTVPFVTFHDAYRYLERRYDLTNAGSVSTSDGRMPGAARMTGLKHEIGAQGVRCGFAEPQFDPALLETAGEGGALTIAVLDPMGSTLAPGPGFYGDLMRALMASLTGCLSQ